MKKTIFSLVAAGLVLTSCNKNTALTAPADSDGSDIVKVAYNPSMLDINESFIVSGKAASLTYTYKNYATPPIGQDVNGTYWWLAATASTMNRDVVFVTWHQKELIGGDTRSGAVSAYKWDNSQSKFVYKDQVTFSQTEYYELTSELNTLNGTYELFMAGQRDPSASGYLLANHGGAVVTRLDYNYITDQFDGASFKQLPLPGAAATDIVAAAGDYYITTGNGVGSDPNSPAANASFQGGVYKTDYNLNVVSEAFTGNSTFSDFQAITVDPTAGPTVAGISTLARSVDANGVSTFGVETYHDVSSNLNTMDPVNFWTVDSNDAREAIIEYYGSGLAASNSEAMIAEQYAQNQPVGCQTADPLLANYCAHLAGEFKGARMKAMTNYERMGLTYVTTGNHNDENLFVSLGDWGFFSADYFDGGLVGLTYADYKGNHGYCANLAYDPNNGVVYYASAEGGLSVVAGANYNGGILINEGDLIGKFVPQTGAGLPANPAAYVGSNTIINTLPDEFMVKDASVYEVPSGGTVVVIANGEGGVYFVNQF